MFIMYKYNIDLHRQKPAAHGILKLQMLHKNEIIQF